MMLRIRTALIAVALCTVTGMANAAVGWTGAFVITQLYVSSAENYHVRAFGAPSNSACIGFGSTTWYYINQSAAGSKEYIAALMIAYTTGRPVNVYWQNDANGYCQIVELISN